MAPTLSPSIEAFNAFSTFLSSVVIAIASIVITSKYNKQQSAITQHQAKSELEIARNKEIATLIPKLGSDVANERKFSAIALSLYGTSAIHALIASLDDEIEAVREASSKSLVLIGAAAIPKLTDTFVNIKNPEFLRSMAIYTLGSMNAPDAVHLAVRAIEDPRESTSLKSSAATALGRLKDSMAVPVLLRTAEHASNAELIDNAIWALGEIGERSVCPQLTKLLAQASEQVRVRIVWVLVKLRDSDTENTLLEISTKDGSPLVRKAAGDAITWMKND